jgi:hypothetical protein
MQGYFTQPIRGIRRDGPLTQRLNPGCLRIEFRGEGLLMGSPKSLRRVKRRQPAVGPQQGALAAIDNRVGRGGSLGDGLRRRQPAGHVRRHKAKWNAGIIQRRQPSIQVGRRPLAAAEKPNFVKGLH